MIRLYLAGPDVFRPDAREIGARKAALCQAYGLLGIVPVGDDLDTEGQTLARAIFLGNVQLLRSCDLVLADLSPFRGPGADDGTAFEIGFAHAPDGG